MALRFEDDFLKKLEYLHVISKKAFAGQNRADRLARKRGRGLEFADHRQYAPGDDFRHIDWKAYQRLNRLLLRLFDEEQDLPIYLFIDASRSMAEAAKFDQARRIAAALCYIGLAHLDRVTILTFGGMLGGETQPGRGKGRIFRVFDQLERLETSGTTDLRETFKQFASRSRQQGLAVVISDFLDPQGFGMEAVVDENLPHEKLSLRLVGEIKDGRPVADSPLSQTPAFERYVFTARPDGGTRLTVHLQSWNDGFTDFLADSWPKALQRLKALAESTH